MILFECTMPYFDQLVNFTNFLHTSETESLQKKFLFFNFWLLKFDFHYSIGRCNVTSGLHVTRWREYIYCDSNSQQVLS